MKKILLSIVILFILTGCSGIAPIKEKIYVCSMGFDYKDGKYIVYLFIPSSTSLGKNEQAATENDSHIAKKEGESIGNILEDLQLSTELEVKYNQLSSIILTNSFISRDNVIRLFQTFKNHNDFPLNFFVFACGDDLEDIYKIKNPDNSSTINAIFANPQGNVSSILYLSPVYFLSFYTSYVDGYYPAKISYLESTKNIWENSEKLVTVDTTGLCYVNDKATCFNKDEYPGFGFLDNKSLAIIKANNKEFQIRNYEIKLIKEKHFILTIKAHAHLLYAKEEVNDDGLIRDINDYFLLTIKDAIKAGNDKGIDVLGIQDFYYRMGKIDEYVSYRDEKIDFRIEIILEE